MLRARKNDQIIVASRLSGALLILAQLIACGPTIESGGGPMDSETGGGGSGSSGNGGSSSTGNTGGTGSTGGGALTPCECIAAYGGSWLGDDALMQLRDEGLPACFHKDDPVVLDMERACLPSVVGQHAGHGRDIEVYYFCSDICPDYGRVGIRFSGITDKDACCAIDGIPLLDPAWGGFEACVPSAIHPMVAWVADCP